MSEILTDNAPTLFNLIEICYDEPDLEKASAACEQLNGQLFVEEIFPQLQAQEKYKLLLETLESIPDAPRRYYAGLRVLVALTANRGDLLKRAGVEVVEPLFNIWQAKVRLISSRARLTLRRLRGREAREEMCRLALQENQYMMRSIVLEAGFYPQEIRKRILFFFLTAQWRPYEELDFDYRQIKSIYDTANPTLKQRIITVARKAGRPELIPVIIGANQQKRQLKSEDWDLLITSLGEGKRWLEAWEIAKTAPAMYAVRLVKMLARADWQPDTTEEQALLNDLLPCAVNLATDRFPFVPNYDPVFEYQLPFFENGNFAPDSQPLFAVSRDCQYSAVVRADSTLEVWGLRESSLVASFAPDTIPAFLGINSKTFSIVKLALSADVNWIGLIYKIESSGAVICNFLLIEVATRQIFRRNLIPYAANIGDEEVMLDGLIYFPGVLTGAAANFFDADMNISSNFISNTIEFSPTGEILVATIDSHIFILREADFKQIDTITSSYPYDRSNGNPGSLEIIFNSSGTHFLVGQNLQNADNLEIENSYSYDITSLQAVVPLCAGALSDDALCYLLAFANRQLQLWQRPSPTAVNSAVLRAERQADFPEMFSAVITPDKKYVITGHRNLLMFWTLPDLQLVNVVTAHYGAVRELFFADDGLTLVSIGDDGKIKYWNSHMYKLTEKSVDQTTPNHVEAVRRFKAAMVVNESGRAWLDFLEIYLYRRIQYAIEIGDFAAGVIAQQDDIELEIE